MKFLIFNVVVIGALAYLAIGPGGADLFQSDQAGPAPVAAKPAISKPTAAKASLSTLEFAANSLRSPMFTTWYSVRKMLVKPRFAKRWISGIWPPSNPRRT